MREYEIEQQERYYDGLESMYGEGFETDIKCNDTYMGFDISFLIDTYGSAYKYRMGGLSLIQEDYEKWLCINRMAY